jgi:NAD kinase
VTGREGVLVPHTPEAAADLLADAAAGRAALQHRTMAAAHLDDGQTLPALNEVFIGYRAGPRASTASVYGCRRPRRKR